MSDLMRIAPNTSGDGRRVGVVVSRFNGAIGDQLLAGALRALAEAGVAERDTVVVSVPGALESPLALQRLAQAGDFDALVALGAVIRGETYHFEIVAGESARGLMALSMDGLAIGNGILTTEDEAQALTRAKPTEKDKGGEAAKAALAMLALRERFA